MAWASTQAMLSLLDNNLGQCGLHVCALPISAFFGISHGEALALVMPFVLAELAKIRPEKVSGLVAILSGETADVGNLTVREALDLAVQEMDEWLGEIGLRRTLKDYGVSDADVQALAGSVNMARLADAWGREVSEEEMAENYRKCL